MKLFIMTIALDGMPYLPMQLEQYEKLSIPWQWTIVHGVAARAHCTSWVRGIPGRLSEDGTTEWLKSVSRHPNIRILEKPLWDGKIEQCNAALSTMQREAGVLLEADCDEIHKASNLEAIVAHFKHNRRVGAMRLACRYYVGENLILRGEDCYGNNPGEWLRVWRYYPGDKWEKHEPPVLRQNLVGRIMSRDETRAMGWVFDHYSYHLEEPTRRKMAYYGYNGIESWKALQSHKDFPCKLNQFFPWSDDRAEVIRLA